TFHEHGVKRPGKCGGEGDEQPGPGNMSAHSTGAEGKFLRAARRIRCGERAIAGLKPDDAESAEQAEHGADLKLPLANDVAFLRKKCEREQGSENYGRAIEDRVDAGAHVEERNDLCDLMDDIGNARNEAKAERIDVDLGASTTYAVEAKWCD